MCLAKAITAEFKSVSLIPFAPMAWEFNMAWHKIFLNWKGKRCYLHNILNVLIELFTLEMFVFLVPPKAFSLMELGNAFWLLGQKFLPNDFYFPVSKRADSSNERQVFGVGLFKRPSDPFVLCETSFHTYSFKRKGIIPSKVLALYWLF